MAQRIFLTAVLALSLVAIGCTTTVMNPGTDSSATYRFGRLTAQEARDITAVYQAAEAAMTDLGLSVVQKVRDDLEARIIARDAQDKKIIVELISLTKTSTEVKVRVGSLEKARRIHQTIHENL
jgi:Protein of unknown function (DUF3568)